MTSEEFHALVEQYTYEPGDYNESAPLTLAQLARLERQKGIRFPAFYKEFLSMYGAGRIRLRHCFITESRKWISDLGNHSET